MLRFEEKVENLSLSRKTYFHFHNFLAVFLSLRFLYCLHFQLFVYVYNCLFIFTVVCLHLQLFVYIFSCLFTFTLVCLHFQLFVYETFGADNLGTSIGKYDFVLQICVLPFLR